MLPIDIMRETASASARVLSRAIAANCDADQVEALLSIVKAHVQMLAENGADQSGAAPLTEDAIAPASDKVISLAARRAARQTNQNERST